MLIISAGKDFSFQGMAQYSTPNQDVSWIYFTRPYQK